MAAPDGRRLAGPSAAAPYSKKQCLAAVTNIFVVSRCRDIHGGDAVDSRHVATRKVGPANIEIAAGDKRIELPLERWSPKPYSVEAMAELPRASA